MNSFSPVAKAALVCACLSSAAFVSAQDVVRARVSPAGIDRSTASGRHQFNQRLTLAAWRACRAGAADDADVGATIKCVREMRSDAAAQLAAPGMLVAAR